MMKAVIKHSAAIIIFFFTGNAIQAKTFRNVNVLHLFSAIKKAKEIF